MVYASPWLVSKRSTAGRITAANEHMSRFMSLE